MTPYQIAEEIAQRVACDLLPPRTIITPMSPPESKTGRQRQINRLRDKLALAFSEAIKSERECPGVWVCDKCGFTQFKSILHTQNGAISTDARPHLEPCPNDGRDMRPVTWKERCEDLAKICEGQILRAVKAEARIVQLEHERFIDPDAP